MYNEIGNVITIPIKQQGVARIINVKSTGRCSFIISLSRFSNTPHIVACITVFPSASSPGKRVSIKYMEGEKYFGSYEPKIYYLDESDGSISILVTTPAYETCGYRLISTCNTDTTVSFVNSIAETAIQI